MWCPILFPRNEAILASSWAWFQDMILVVYTPYHGLKALPRSTVCLLFQAIHR